MKHTVENFGLTAMAVFLFFGAAMATFAGITLLFPGSFLDPIWRLNPDAGEQLRQLGRGVGIAFLGLGAAMIAAAVGWIKRHFWGWALAVVIVASQVLGDLVNAFRGEWLKGVLGAAIAGALLVYLTRRNVRDAFERETDGSVRGS
ncbi:MAG TPA: hypothetical protein VGH17_07790 [Candidatus Acidoferrales bacterium]